MTLHEDWHKAHPGYPCEYDTCPRGQMLDIEAATYTAAEVKVLTETASKVGYALGRKGALEDLETALGEVAPGSMGAAGYKLALAVLQDASEPRTDPPVPSDLPPEPQAVRSPQEDDNA